MLLRAILPEIHMSVCGQSKWLHGLASFAQVFNFLSGHDGRKDCFSFDISLCKNEQISFFEIFAIFRLMWHDSLDYCVMLCCCNIMLDMKVSGQCVVDVQSNSLSLTLNIWLGLPSSSHLTANVHATPSTILYFESAKVKQSCFCFSKFCLYQFEANLPISQILITTCLE